MVRLSSVAVMFTVSVLVPPGPVAVSLRVTGPAVFGKMKLGVAVFAPARVTAGRPV